MERFNLRVLSPSTALQKAEADIYENVAPTFARHHIGIGQGEINCSILPSGMGGNEECERKFERT